MSIPILFKSVSYKVAGEYAYKGDLVVTHGVLYYFPHTDLIQKRTNTAVGFVAGGVAGRLARRNIMRQESYDRDEKRMELYASSQTLQQKLDAEIADLKEKRSSVSANSLPLPIRYDKNNIKNIQFGFFGPLTLEDHYDTHAFKIGVFKKRRLREALTEAGFAV